MSNRLPHRFLVFYSRLNETWAVRDRHTNVMTHKESRAEAFADARHRASIYAAEIKGYTELAKQRRGVQAAFNRRSRRW